MKYQEYLIKLNELFILEHELVLIYKNEVDSLAEEMPFVIKEKDYYKINLAYQRFTGLEMFYKNRKKAKLQHIDKSKLSVKQTLLIIKNLVDTLFVRIICLEEMKKTFDSKLKAKAVVKQTTKAMNHFKKVYLQVRALTEELNLTYNDDLSMMNFGLNLIDDKPIDLINFDKVLISNEWIKILEDY